MENKFELVSKYKPAGDQPKAIEKLVQGLRDGDDTQTLLGITGSGKTFTIANVIQEIQKACNWARLYGGGGLVIMVDQNPALPLDMKAIKEDSKLEFKAADMWELYKDQANIWNPWEDDRDDVYYNYYGVRLHRSRVLPVCGKEAPSFIRPRLRGWGMSELERVVRSINSYLKNQDLIFELLDEAKLDIYQMNGFNAAMLTSSGTKTAEKRIQMANSLKSYPLQYYYINPKKNIIN